MVQQGQPVAGLIASRGVLHPPGCLLWLNTLALENPMTIQEPKVVGGMKPRCLVVIKVSEHEQASFFACLVLGTLQAIKSGALPPTAGIWTLGRPKIREVLAELSTTPPELLHILEVADEFSALSQMAPDRLQVLLDQLLLDSSNMLRRRQDALWNIDIEVISQE